MSVWNDIDDQDIDVEMDEKEIHILVGQDDFGGVWAVLTFDQIDKIYEQIHEEKEKQITEEKG